MIFTVKELEYFLRAHDQDIINFDIETVEFFYVGCDELQLWPEVTPM